jgi:hypothetical protein
MLVPESFGILILGTGLLFIGVFIAYLLEHFHIWEDLF